jgi:hypothetical protein
MFTPKVFHELQPIVGPSCPAAVTAMPRAKRIVDKSFLFIIIGCY